MLNDTLASLSESAAALAGRITATRARSALAPLLLALLFCCLNLWVFPRFESLYTELIQIDFGGFLLAGLPGSDVTLNMPFAEILVSAALSLGVGPEPLFIVLHLGLYALVFFTGCLLRGYWAGLLALVIAGLFGVGRELIYEQAVYTWFLLLVLALTLLHREKRSLKSGLLCGLAIGSSMLVRTPLFLFAPLFIICDRPGTGESRAAFVRRSLAFLAVCYALLVPWGLLNRAETGQFRLFDTQRSANNVIIAAMGGVYSTFANSAKAAGLAPGETPAGYYFREAARRPFFFAVGTLRRLWHILLFYPVFFAFLLAALALSREREKALVFCLPVYFAVVHSAVALEKRYLYPLPYLLPPLLTGTFVQARREDLPEARAFAGKAVLAAFWLTFCAVLCVEALVLAYPLRSGRAEPAPGAYGRASELFPGDRRLCTIKCAELWVDGADDAYAACMLDYGRRFRDPVAKYLFTVMNAPSAAAAPLPTPEEMRPAPAQIYAARMLRELELGDREAAKASFGLAYRELNPAGPKTAYDWQHLTPYKNDQALRERLNSDTDWFWDTQVYETLKLWPARRVPKILAEISAVAPLSPRLARLGEVLGQARDGRLSWPAAGRVIRGDVFGARGGAPSARAGAPGEGPR